MQKKLIVITGPTASGKSDYAITIAKKYNGEIVSADSRQVYKGMDIGSGKIMKKEMQNIPHHLLSIVSPKKVFTVAEYQKRVIQELYDIWKRGKLPILCGGTGLYIQAVVDGIVIPEVKPNLALRKKLEKINVDILFQLLKKKDPRRAQTIDSKNPRRLIRALEIIDTLGKVPKLELKPLDANILFIGIKKNTKELKKLIHKRLLKRMKNGMVREVKNLHHNGVSWKRLEDFGLEYRYIAQFLQEKITKQEMLMILEKEINAYSKRQMTWFSAHGGSASSGKKEKRIHWIHNRKEMKLYIENFL